MRYREGIIEKKRIILYYFRSIKRETVYVTLSNASQDIVMVVFVTLKSIQCKYFDDVGHVWETSGCTVVNSTTSATICRCNRVAQFGVSEMSISTELSFHNLPVILLLLLLLFST